MCPGSMQVIDLTAAHVTALSHHQDSADALSGLLLVCRAVISFTHFTMQRKGARIGEPNTANAKGVDDPLHLGIHARETPEERSLRKRVFLRDDLPWCGTSADLPPQSPFAAS